MNGMNVLIFNAGSSSLKFCLLDAPGERTLADGEIDWAVEPARLKLRHGGEATAEREGLIVRTPADAVAQVLRELRLGPSGAANGRDDELWAVAHRVVHGGDRRHAAV